MNLILLFFPLAVKASNKAVTPAEIESFLIGYINTVSDAKSRPSVGENFKARVEDDIKDFRSCLKTPCQLKMRDPIVPDESIKGRFEARFDVVNNGKSVARRAGCYIVESEAGRLMVKDYIYDCDGK